VFSFQVPTKGSEAARREKVRVKRRASLAVFTGSSHSRCNTPRSGAN